MITYHVQVNFSRPVGQGIETFWQTVNTPANHDDARILADRTSAINHVCTRIEVHDQTNNSRWVTAIYGEQYPILPIDQWAKERTA